METDFQPLGTNPSSTKRRVFMAVFFIVCLVIVPALAGCLGAYIYYSALHDDKDSSSSDSSSSSSSSTDSTESSTDSGSDDSGSSGDSGDSGSSGSSGSSGDSGDSSSSSGQKGFTDNLIFEDNFDSLDLDTWQHEITMSGGGNWEFEYYTNNRSNSYIRDGVLYIKPTLTNDTFTSTDFLFSGTIDLYGSTPADQCTAGVNYGCFRTGSASNPLNPVQSARLRTVNSFNFRYGKIEVRAQMPRGDWIWPAIWLLPAKNTYGQWPASGEIDVVEVRSNYDLDCSGLGAADGDHIGIGQMGSTQHWGPYFGANRYALTHEHVNLADDVVSELYSDDFHVWTVEWGPTGFKYYLDDDEDPYMTVNSTEFGGYWSYGEFDTNQPNSFNPWSGTVGDASQGGLDAPFDQEFFFILNVAIGGTAGFFPDSCTSRPGGTVADYAKPWSDSSSTAFYDFWNARDSWYPTWFPFEDNGEGAAMKIDYIRVYEYVE